MRKKITTVCLLITMLFLLLPSPAGADVITGTLPEVNAASYVVIDAGTGDILFGNNYQQQSAPASITKIMTAILAIESGKLDEQVTIGDLPDFSESGAVIVYLGKGESYTLRSLVEVMLVASANDAAVAVADAVGGSTEKFVTMMNDKAKELNMTGTVFKNPHGLDEDGHLVTAEDMAKLARYAMQNETFREMVQLRQVDWNGIGYIKSLPNTNQLLTSMPEATGIKTGNTSSAQHTLVGSAKRENRELIGVILGAPDEGIFQDMRTILNYGFDHTRVIPVVQKDSLETILEYGDKQVRVAAGEDYSVVQSTDNAAIVTYQRRLTDVELPIHKDSQVGVLEVLVDGNAVHEVPLIAQDDVRAPINWLFLVTLVLSLVYIASICTRIVHNIRKSRRKRAAANRAAARQENRGSDSAAYPAEPPAQGERPSGRKTLSSSRDRDPNRR